MRILVVEDDEAISRALKDVLTHVGHQVACVVSMAQCPGAVVNFQPEAVILDLGLPDTQGLETLEAMGGLVDNHVPVIVFTSDAINAEMAMKMGANQALVKGEVTPIDMPQVVEFAIANHKLVGAMDRHDAWRNGEISWPGASNVEPEKVGDDMMTLAAELKMASGG